MLPALSLFSSSVVSLTSRFLFQFRFGFLFNHSIIFFRRAIYKRIVVPEFFSLKDNVLWVVAKIRCSLSIHFVCGSVTGGNGAILNIKYPQPTKEIDRWFYRFLSKKIMVGRTKIFLIQSQKEILLDDQMNYDTEIILSNICIKYNYNE